ncbi:response regulator transcription factor [Bacillus daqingensis]|uniref:Response regulator transcription factor n=1 Tax=Bacillus daqingensis TaxID=872396 RepID=A0ABV9NVF1_9BACI
MNELFQRRSAVDCIGEGDFTWSDRISRALTDTPVHAHFYLADDIQCIAQFKLDCQHDIQSQELPVLITKKPLSAHDVLDLQELFPVLVSAAYVDKHPHHVEQAITNNHALIEPYAAREMAVHLHQYRRRDNPIKEFHLVRNKLAKLLTELELDIVACIIQGMNTKETAKTVYLAESTTATMLSGIYDKLSVSNRTQLVYICIHNNWLEAERT